MSAAPLQALSAPCLSARGLPALCCCEGTMRCRRLRLRSIDDRRAKPSSDSWSRLRRRPSAASAPVACVLSCDGRRAGSARGWLRPPTGLSVPAAAPRSEPCRALFAVAAGLVRSMGLLSGWALSWGSRRPSASASQSDCAQSTASRWPPITCSMAWSFRSRAEPSKTSNERAVVRRQGGI